MIKAVFFDIDGTLLSHRTFSVPDSARAAMSGLRGNGIKTFIATGRHAAEIARLPLEGLEFDGFVTLNGQYCYQEDGRVIYSSPIDRRDVKAILDDLSLHAFPCMFVEADRMYINYHTPLVKKVQDSISTPLPDIGDLNRGLSHDIYQIIPYVEENQENRILALAPHCQKTRWHDLAIDLLPAGGGKQNGIREMLRFYDMKREEIMVFGDGENDIDMMEYAGISVAMGNASPQVKAAAGYITDDIDQDGIWRALRHFQMIGEH